MERQQKQSADIPKWSALLVEAVNKPGLIMKAYSNFHSYSLGNQLLALVRCQMRGLQPGPINTFPKWRELGRHVKRGERALMLCMPITRKRRNEPTDEQADGGYARVQADLADPRHVGRHHRRQQAHRPDADQQSKRATDPGEDGALDEEMPDQPAA